MSFEADEEILQDFLIEAGEILEAMSEQLVALENEPEDMDLLNGIFRGFHTVKGGAGFLALEPLVEICHITENIFDILRNGERVADADLMDQILHALDIINEMFDSVRNGDYPSSAEPDFLEKLGTYAHASNAETQVQPTVEKEKASANEALEEISDDEFDDLLNELNSAQPKPVEAVSDDITDDEFEALLDELHGTGQFNAASDEKQVSDITPATESPQESSPSGDITDDEFEALLDELHGKNGTVGSEPTSPAQGVNSANSDLIDDEEFEALLDQLHGTGKGPGKNDGANQAASQPVKTTESAGTNGGNKNEQVAAQNTNSISVSKTNKTASISSPSKKEKVASKPVIKKPVAKKAPTANVAEATVRVDTKRLDDIMNMVGELVLARNRLKTLGQSSQDEVLTKAIANLDIVTGDLQGAVMKTRMQPIKKVFGRFPRVVRDLARSLKKEISLEMVGEDTDLDKNLVEALADPLVHLVRNSVDHGIESPEGRVAAGKVRNGTIVLSAAQEGDHIMLSIEDDGKGMDADVLRNIAINKGLMDKEHAERLTDIECYNLIFMAGFSTKEEISDISGRGVGMDVVKTKITQLNGSIAIDSELGKGTKILIKVPLTLAILPTLMVKVKQQAFALPLTSVNEIFHLDLTKTNMVDGQLVIVVREKALPLFFLNEWLAQGYSSGERESEGHVVLIQVGTQRVGFVVDSLIGQEEVVIKPLGKSLQGTPGMAGATITSDGGIALIIDIPSLLKHYAG